MTAPAALRHHPDFRRLWIGGTISQLGSHITRSALPILGVTLLAATPAQMGMLTAIGTAPALLAGLFAGAWVDRLRRRPVMIISDLARAMLLGTIPVAAAFGVLHIGLIYCVTFIAGIFSVFFELADLSFLPLLIPPARLVEANSRLRASESIAEITGPAIAGILVRTITVPFAILADAVSFLASAFFIARIRTPEKPVVTSEQSHLRREIAEGLRLAFSTPILRSVMAGSGAFYFFGSFIGALYWFYTLRLLMLDPIIVGVLIGLGGLGALGGAAIAGRVGRRLGAGMSMILALFLFGAANLLLPLAGGSIYLRVGLPAIAQLVGDCALTIYFINEVTVQQIMIPNQMMGRLGDADHGDGAGPSRAADRRDHRGVRRSAACACGRSGRDFRRGHRAPPFSIALDACSR
ncbi:MAG: transporter [Chlorobi bacterium]|nr:transporter [Chlorobiota bacterium]